MVGVKSTRPIESVKPNVVYGAHGVPMVELETARRLSPARKLRIAVLSNVHARYG